MVEAFRESRDLLLITFLESDSVKISEPQVHLLFFIDTRVYITCGRVLYKIVGYNNVTYCL